VDLQTVVNETVEVYRPLARAKGLELQVECSGEQLITAPPGTASIVLQNLVENAIRFTDHGSVRVLLEPGRMAVEDTGVGLSGVDRSRIFERGYRSDASPGSGLGLDLIRRVCDRVGWQVSAQQRPTGGSRFEVIFSTSAVA
jgi:signal transduction histidine kinase